VSHRLNIQHALISLFEIPVPENDPVGRAVLTRILGEQDIDFDIGRMTRLHELSRGTGRTAVKNKTKTAGLGEKKFV
jgi:hypothetical protein